MLFTQKEEGLGAYNSSVQINYDGEFALVPESPLLLEVQMPFLQFHTPSIRIDNPSDEVVYLVSLQNGQLTIEEVPIGQGAAEAGPARSGRSRSQGRKRPGR